MFFVVDVAGSPVRAPDEGSCAGALLSVRRDQYDYVINFYVRQNSDVYVIDVHVTDLNVIDDYVINIHVRRNPDACVINVYVRWNAVHCC